MNRKNMTLLEGWVSIAVNCLLFAAKLWAGMISGSIAVIADAWHTLSDSFSSVIVVFGAHTSSRPADKEHPFGHGRMELISAVIIGVLLAMTGIGFIFEAVERFTHRSHTEFRAFVLIVIAASVVIKEITARFAIWTWKKTGVPALKADGAHHRSDALSSLVILVGITFGRSFWWSDSVLAMLVSLFILHAAWGILKEGIDPLLGQVPDKKLVDQVRAVSHEACGSCDHFHHFHIHAYGSHTELTFHIRLDPDMTIRQGHAEATRIERALLENLNIHATIHIEPDELTIVK